MKWFKNLKTQNKLFVAFGIPALLLVILASFTVSTIYRIDSRHLLLNQGPMKRLSYASDAVRDLTNIRRYILTMGYVAEDTETVDQYFAMCQESAEQFLHSLDSYRKNLQNDPLLTGAERDERMIILSGVVDTFNGDYREYVNDVYNASGARDRQRINDLLLDGIPLGDKITAELDYLREIVNATVDNSVVETQEYSATAAGTVTALAACIVIITLLASFIMSRAIKTPIVNMEAAVAEISKGNLAYPIRSDFADELGTLSNSIGDMVDTISMLNKTVTIVDNLDDMIYVSDLDYNMIYMNKRAAEVYNADRDQIAGRKCYNVIFGSDRPCSFCPLPALLPGKETFPSVSWEREGQIDGSHAWLAYKTSVIRWVDGSLVQIYTCKDDTLRKEHDEQQLRHEQELREAALAAEEASRMKSAFLANTSHEIRTPMNGIIGFAELALDGNISPVTRDYLLKIKESSEGLLQIINDILDISKIEAGKIMLENIPFDIHDVFRACQAIASPKALEKGIILYCYAEPSVDRRLLGDPTRLRQALLNLLSNSVKFTNTGIVKLLSVVEVMEEDSVTMHFEVKDSGIGMTPEQIDRIFDPFMQADATMTRKYGGTGLGLSITRNIVELMGGKLLAESTPGVGSKFSFDLTFKTIDVLVDSPSDGYKPVEIEKPVFSGEVLICEDNVMNQQVLCEHLKRVGLDFVVAQNGREGVETVRSRIKSGEKPFDLIFMDIHMPVMDGLEASSELEKIGNTSPIVAITANVMTNDRETYKAYGMPDYVAKPFTAQELWACLLRHITPVYMRAVNEKEQTDSNKNMHNQLLINFWKDNQNTYRDILNAIDGGDIKLAHRRVHTLKGVAALIGKTVLQQAAYTLERSLSGQMAEFTEDQLSTLERELNAVLSELALLFDHIDAETPSPQSPGAAVTAFDREKAISLIGELEPLIKTGNTDCLDMLDGLASIPGTRDLIDQIEHFDFAAARKTLAGIKRDLGCDE